VNKLYLITKEKYGGHQRKLGFFRFQNDDIYFDFGMLDGSHTSYHEDGSVWRTSPATGGKAIREEQRLPIREFKGYYNLGVVMITKKVLSDMHKVKERDAKKSILFVVDVEKYPCSVLNIVSELIEPGFHIPLPEKEKKLPPKADVALFEEFSPWIHITVLGFQENLLVYPEEKGFTVKHFNERFTANKEDNNYSAEAYAGKFIKGLNRDKN
jgi:hypothetical protein